MLPNRSEQLRVFPEEVILEDHEVILVVAVVTVNGNNWLLYGSMHSIVSSSRYF